MERKGNGAHLVDAIVVPNAVDANAPLLTPLKEGSLPICRRWQQLVRRVSEEQAHRLLPACIRAELCRGVKHRKKASLFLCFHRSRHRRRRLHRS